MWNLARAIAVTAVAVFIVAMLALDARATYGARVTADEPQYLLTALSLAEDFDLDISDELEAERFRPFHEVELNPQTLELGPSGQRLSPHDPLFPLILAIPTSVGGWLLAKITLAALAALTATATLRLAVRRFDVRVGPATAIVVVLFCSPPLTSYATQLYPEMPAALAVVVGVDAILGPRSRRRDIAVLIAIVALPWLAVKYAGVAAVLAAAFVWRLWRSDRRHAVAAVSALAFAGLAYLVIHQRVYGGWTVYAAGDHFVDGEFLVVGADPNYLGRSRRLIGLVIDRGFGLAAWTPAYLLLIPALAALWRRHGMGGGRLAVACVGVGSGVATWVALTMHGWWWPGRQVVVVLPLGVVAIAAFVDHRPRLRTVTVAGSLVGTANWLWLVFESSTDRRTLIVDFVATANPLYRAWSALLPDHIAPTSGDWLLTWVWAATITALTVWAWRAEPAVLERPTPASPLEVS